MQVILLAYYSVLRSNLVILTKETPVVLQTGCGSALTQVLPQLPMALTTCS